MISSDTLKFLKNLEKNNTREWYAEHKKIYERARKEFTGLLDIAADQLNQNDVIDTKKIFRINRDVRFSKDKSPYKTNLSGYFTRVKAPKFMMPPFLSGVAFLLIAGLFKVRE